MNDRWLRDALSRVDNVKAPSLWQRVEDLEIGAQGRGEHERSVRERALIAVAALCIGVAGVVVAVRAYTVDHRGEHRPARQSGSGESPAAGHLTFQGSSGDILVSEGDASPETFIKRDGDQGTAGLSFVWSPDGHELAFVDYDDDGNLAVFVSQLGSTDRLRISGDLTDADSPAWSPDGRNVAFSASRGGATDIYVFSRDDRTLRRVTREATNGVDGAHFPSWSPDGSQLAFSGTRYDEGSREETQAIYVIDVIGSDAAQVTRGSAIDEVPSWSPRGDWISFIRKTQGDAFVGIVHPNGTGQRLAADPVVPFGPPAWHPSGASVAFASIPGGGPATMDVVTGNVEDLVDVGTLGQEYVEFPGLSWSLDGELLAFSAGPRTGETAIFIVSLETGDVSQVELDESGFIDPVWR